VPRFLSRVNALGQATGAAPLAIGANTTGNDGGALFGTDTALYRSGGNVLACNQLDQTVPPVKTYYYSGSIPGTLSSGSVTQALAAAFSMPFKGDFELHGWVNIQAVGTGLVLPGAGVTNGPGGLAPTSAPQSLVRMTAGTDFPWACVPVAGFWSAVPVNTTMNPALIVAYGGGNGFTIPAYAIIGKALRTL
jgi:hypothetical protein